MEKKEFQVSVDYTQDQEITASGTIFGTVKAESQEEAEKMFRDFLSKNPYECGWYQDEIFTLSSDETDLDVNSADEFVPDFSTITVE